ncbi:MAG: ATP-dependent DNA helicase RecG, partial [Prevotella sp.]
MNSILDQDIMFLPGVGPGRKELLGTQLSIKTWRDLLEYYPYKYVDRTKIYTINELRGDMPFVQIKGKILSFDEFTMSARRKRIVAHFSDTHGVVDLVWFRGTQWVYKSYKVGEEYLVFGKPTVFQGRYQFAHPEMEKSSEVNLTAMGMQPYYITTEQMKNRGLQSRAIEKLTKTLATRIPTGAIKETLPPSIISRLNLISREDAYRKIHYPQSLDDVQRAQVRLKFEELFFVQLNILRYAAERRQKFAGYVFPKIGSAFNTFFNENLPFELTGAQKRVMHEIREDLRSGHQMNRLLQGDVGSGKTLVALLTMLIAIDNDFQACIMAPTEILAEQHMDTIQRFMVDMGVRIELLTGMVKGKRRTEILEGLSEGTVDILVGTHAIIEDTVQFKRLGVAVVDEQHRFGVAQRARLWGKSDRPPHILVMTATPIPRTLAMTIYGDLDVSVIDELPPGRKPIVTLHKYENQATSLYNGIRQQIQEGRQVYIVFPLIEESEKIDLKNLEDGYRHLCEVFPEFS